MNRFVKFVSATGKEWALINAPLVTMIEPIPPTAEARRDKSRYLTSEKDADSWYPGPVCLVSLLGGDAYWVRGDAAEVARELEWQEPE